MERQPDHWMVKRVKNVINGTESMHTITVSGRKTLRRNDTDTSQTRVSSSQIISDNCPETPLSEVIEKLKNPRYWYPHFEEGEHYQSGWDFAFLTDKIGTSKPKILTHIFSKTNEEKNSKRGTRVTCSLTYFLRWQEEKRISSYFMLLD